MKNLWRRWRRPAGARPLTTPSGDHEGPGSAHGLKLRPGLILREAERGRIFRLDRRLRGADGRGYWILAEIDESGIPAPARRLVSEDRLGQWQADR